MTSYNVLNKKFIPNLTLNEFLEECKIFVQEYSCPLCEGILNESVIDKCGHSFCKSCIEVLLNETNFCPFSNSEIIPQKEFRNRRQKNCVTDYLFINRAVNGLIEKQNVYCKNKSSNCAWTGKLEERKNHLLNDCEKEIINCEYSTDCNAQITREQFATHLTECPYRTVLCHHCQQYASFNSLEKHYKVCANFPTECVNGCGLSVAASQMNIHLELECDNSMVECPFSVVGCSFNEIRKELKLHLDKKLEEHLKMISGKMKSLEDLSNSQRSQIVLLQKENEYLKLDIENTKSLLMEKQEVLLDNISMVNKNLENFKLYSIVPISNFLPNFSNSNDLKLISEIFKIEGVNPRIKKSQNNYGWYGISSENIFNEWNSSKIIVNMKILQTSHSCIFFGVTFSNFESPKIKGYYTLTDEENISYMLYTHNCSLYTKGVSLCANGIYEPSQEGDIITLIIDLINSTISFKRNGVTVIQGTEIVNLKDENYRDNLKIAVDLTDYGDEVIFIP